MQTEPNTLMSYSETLKRNFVDAIIANDDVQMVGLLHKDIWLLGVQILDGMHPSTPLHLALGLHNHPRDYTHVVEVMLCANEDCPGNCLESLNWDGSTPLHAAVKAGYNITNFFGGVKSCDVNAQDFNGNTALHYAASMNSGDAVHMLLKNHAQPAIQNGAHQTAGDCAPEGALIRVLLQNGACIQNGGYAGGWARGPRERERGG